MKNILLLLILSVFTFGCGGESKNHFNNVEIENYADGTPLKKVVHFTDFDSVYFYYRNGKVFKKGEQLKSNQKRGKWLLYDKESNLREVREWFPFEGDSRLNRIWHLNKGGDTLTWRNEDSIFQQKDFIHDTVSRRATSFDVIYFNRDTIKLNEPIRGYVEIFSNLIEEQPSNVRVLIAREENNYNSDFSNEKEVRLDTFYDLTIDTVNQKYFKGAKPNLLAGFGQYYKTTGQKKLRGYYQQYYIGPAEPDENGMKIDSVIGPKTYFEHPIVVKDNVK